MMTGRMMRGLLGAVLAAPLAMGCAGILDIEEATLDPALEKGSGGRNGSGGGNGTGGAPEETLCERYCDTVMTNCAGAGFEQFLSRGHCLGYCEKLEEGTPDDNAGNSAGCRLHYAEAAAGGSELGFNCPIAGPGGEGVCGDNCDGFCRVAVQTCGTQMPVATALDCLRNCGNLPDLGGFHAKIQAGFSLQCRLYHLSAAQTDPLLHCPHVAGVGPCSAPPGTN